MVNYKKRSLITDVKNLDIEKKIASRCITRFWNEVLIPKSDFGLQSVR